MINLNDVMQLNGEIAQSIERQFNQEIHELNQPGQNEVAIQDYQDIRGK